MNLLGDPSLAVPSVIYAFLMNVTALTLIAIRQANLGNVSNRLPDA